MNLIYLVWCIQQLPCFIDISWVATGLLAKRLAFPSTTNEPTVFPFE